MTKATQILEVTLENPNGVLRDYTPEEIAQRDLDIEQAEKDKAEFLAKENQFKADALSGNQKLLDLGLTQAEATALTGYTPPVEE
tara:strand:+ start:314 stop:568 length:255 start_codon:yes stop_codon:yes gene_type:complete